MESTRNAVASTSLLVAAMRAEETTRDDPLFADPFADALAGEQGRQLLQEYRSVTGPSSPAIIEIRTRYWDEALLRAADHGASQFVIVAAGMDARAYRLPWRLETVLFEIDQPGVMAAKNAVLADETTRCTRIPVGVDLADDWPAALLSQGFATATKTVWLVEGLLQYLDEAAVNALFSRIDDLSAAGSTLMYDVVGKTLLEAPFLAPLRQYMTQLGAPWTFGVDAPTELVEPRGWTAAVTDAAKPGNAWNRWPAPAVPLDVPDVPRGFFVEATKN
jgi:methyltransferase (TIGR00027 family)